MFHNTCFDLGFLPKEQLFEPRGYRLTRTFKKVNLVPIDEISGCRCILGFKASLGNFHMSIRAAENVADLAVRSIFTEFGIRSRQAAVPAVVLRVVNTKSQKVQVNF